MDQGELIAMAASARANREWMQLTAVLSMLIDGAADPNAKLRWLTDRATIEEVELFDTHALVKTWEAIVALDPTDASRRELARVVALRDG